MYIESTFPLGSSGERLARLSSPKVVVSGFADFCLKFAYHMYGPSDQKLHVYVRPHGQTQIDYSSWNRAGNQGDMWYQAAVNISAPGGYQVR